MVIKSKAKPALAGCDYPLERGVSADAFAGVAFAFNLQDVALDRGGLFRRWSALTGELHQPARRVIGAVAVGDAGRGCGRAGM